MKVCICGTVKNVGQYLTKVMRNMEKIAALFEDYVIILYYDHSNDNTLEILREYCKKNPKLLFYVNKSPLSSFRTHNIAKGRNFCLEKIRASFNDYEYMIMMDCDEVCTNNIKVKIEWLFRLNRTTNPLDFKTSFLINPNLIKYWF